MDNKKLLLYGGIVAVVIVLLYLFKQNQANNIASLNQPGLLNQPSMPSPSAALGSILSGAAGGVSSFLSGDAFDGSNSDLNDPGLDFSDETSFPGMNYTYANSNSYAPAPSDPGAGSVDFSI